MQDKKFSIPLIVGGLFLVIVIGAGGVLVFLSSNNSSTGNNSLNQSVGNTAPVVVTNTVSNTTPMMNNTGNSMMNTSAYKDGTYTTTANYYAPGGDESMGVQITVSNGVISEVNITPQGYGESYTYQRRFAAGISSVVVGKTLDKAHVSRVNGASLTSDGFNTAVDAIKKEAV